MCILLHVNVCKLDKCNPNEKKIDYFSSFRSLIHEVHDIYITEYIVVISCPSFSTQSKMFFNGTFIEHTKEIARLRG